MEDMIPCSLKDQEVFQRVWQRVMAGRSEDSSPIRPGPVDGGDVPCRRLKDLMDQPVAAAPAQSPAPAQEQPPVPEDPCQRPTVPEDPCQRPTVPEDPCQQAPAAQGRSWEGDLVPLWEEPQAGGDRTLRLRGHVMDALGGWQFYRHLARRARGPEARALNSLAGELHQHARKLSAAYFLLTGLRYWPTELLPAPVIPSYWGALRSRHQAEQRLETAFRLAADDWEDPDMLELYGQLADACQQRCRRLRALLEQSV